MRPLRIFQVGNFEPPHSTENHLREALANNGHTILLHNERPETWAEAAQALADANNEAPVDFVLWTSTNDYAPRETFADQCKLLGRAKDLSIPTVGYHLDLWWTLKREHLIREKPFFWGVDVLCTADGGHQEQWANANINHYWFPPGIVESECRVGTPNERYEADVAFVGSWNGYGHRESTHRFQLVDHLREKWNARFWPEPGKPRIDGAQLRDLMASTKVMVGDSAMVPRLKRYWSDRVPNTTGRGCFLLHPEVEGLREQHPDLCMWSAGDWSELDAGIEAALEDPEWRLSTARLCMADTIEHHTYEVRMKELVSLLNRKGLL